MAAETNWSFWRLIFDGGMSFADVKSMDIDELYEANAALDLYIDKVKTKVGDK